MEMIYMLGLDVVVENIKTIEYCEGKIKTKIITFLDGSKLEIACDNTYNYPLSRTSGIASYVGVLEVQYLNMRQSDIDIKRA